MRYLFLLILFSCGKPQPTNHPIFLGEFEVYEIGGCDQKGTCGVTLVKYNAGGSAFEYADAVYPNVNERCYLYQYNTSKFCRWGILSN